jgi:hypothetical protein
MKNFLYRLFNQARHTWMWALLLSAGVSLFYLAFSLKEYNFNVFLAVGLVFAALVGLFVMARYPPEPPKPTPPVVETTLLTPTILVNEIRAAALVSYGQIGQMTVKKERKPYSGEISSALLNPFMGEELVMDVGVRMIAGVNLKHLREEDIRVNGSTVEIDLPPTKVMMVYVDENLTRVVEHKKGWFSGQDISMMDAARREAMDGMVTAAIDKGLLNKASEHAAVAITGIARSLGFEDIRVYTALPPLGAHYEELQDSELLEKVKRFPVVDQAPPLRINGE